MNSREFDVVIVGASAAGCTAAILFAQQGLSVALAERRASADAYKKVCTHFIQSCATPTLRKIGATAAIERAGGVRNRISVRTPWGWIEAPRRTSYGYNLRREKLDPLLRGLATSQSGVSYFPQAVATGLVRSGTRVEGVQFTAHDGVSFELRGSLVVGADGRNSEIAKLSGGRSHARYNARFTYYTYYENLPLRRGSQYWLLGEHLAYAFPNDNGLTLLGCFAPHHEIDAWRSNLEEHFTEFWKSLPDGPPIERANRACEFRGMLKHDNISREVALEGLALIGDAAMSLDPVWGLGCTWAICSADWLVEETALSVVSKRPERIDAALKRYAKRHHHETRGHRWQIEDFARGKKLNPLFKLLLAGACVDGRLADTIVGFLEREIPVTKAMSITNLARAAVAMLVGRRQHGGGVGVVGDESPRVERPTALVRSDVEQRAE